MGKIACDPNDEIKNIMTLNSLKNFNSGIFSLENIASNEEKRKCYRCIEIRDSTEKIIYGEHGCSQLS